MKEGWKTVMKQQKLVEKMTIEEKAAVLSGKTVWQTREIDRLSIPSIFLSDGPHGIRKQAGAGDHLGLNASLNATCFPTAATIANSWDQDLGEEIGQALGEEAASMDVNILLGPGLNIKRSPYGTDKKRNQQGTSRRYQLCGGIRVVCFIYCLCSRLHQKDK